ncbi:hypothetical protein [Halobacteriovorax sp. HLS]|uniref:hypothetical protein n=1 Tax=Halobacteriovorax sp. HLS TaxID=2234000 RepID=UPI000FDA47D2|nr:hypothetical protein [Halobacteriovorax sp. HLS]
MSSTIEEMAMAERKFLHDLSNQLVVAQGMGNIALKKITSDDDQIVDQGIIDKLEKSLRAVDKMVVLVKERRTNLHSITM